MRERSKTLSTLFLALVVFACQPGDEASHPETSTAGDPPEATSGADQAPPGLPRFPLPSDPIARLLLTTPPAPQSLLASYDTKKVNPEKPRILGDTSAPVAKVTISLDGPYASHKISYSVFPDEASAMAAFAAIGATPKERNVVKKQSLTPPGVGTAVWAESAHESYKTEAGSQDIVRTSVATPSANVITLTQVIVEGVAVPEAETFAVDLLKAAREHLEYIRMTAAEMESSAP